MNIHTQTHTVIKGSKLDVNSKCDVNRERAGKSACMCLIRCVAYDRTQMSTRGVRREAREMRMMEEGRWIIKSKLPDQRPGSFKGKIQYNKLQLAAAWKNNWHKQNNIQNNHFMAHPEHGSRDHYTRPVSRCHCDVVVNQNMVNYDSQSVVIIKQQ